MGGYAPKYIAKIYFQKAMLKGWVALLRKTCAISLILTHFSIKMLAFWVEMPRNGGRFSGWVCSEFTSVWHTANPEGYTCIWSIEGNRIYLKAVEVDMYDSKSKKEYTVTYTADTLKDVFKGYRCTRKGIMAKWIDPGTTLRAGKGKVVRYVHAGYNRNHETEMHFRVRNGKIMARSHHNF